MEITRHPSAAHLELVLRGRLDASWAGPLTKALEDAIHEGHHHLVLDFSGVDYLSSGGIAVLVNFYKQLRAIQGSLVLSAVSPRVKEILDLCAMTGLFMPAARAAEPAEAPAPAAVSVLSSANADLQATVLKAPARMRLGLAGHPEKAASGSYAAGDCRELAFPAGTLGLGLGAFGPGFEDSRGRFGEFLALGGSAAFLPTDGATVPDYIVSTRDLVPKIQALHALTAEGPWSHRVRFDAKPDRTLPMAELMESLAGIAGSGRFAVAMVAETASLVGACLQQSPALAGASPSRFAFPEIRDWLTFTTERAHERTLCVVAGLAARSPQGELARFLRPLGKDAELAGHFHAAIFPYQPLSRTALELDAFTASLFDSGSMTGLLHLLADDREFAGVGQSEFWRGACWISPLDGGEA